MDEKTKEMHERAAQADNMEKGKTACPHDGKCIRRLPFLSPKLCYQQRRSDYCQVIIRLAARLAVFSCIAYVLIHFDLQYNTTISVDAPSSTSLPATMRPKVKLEAHIMSKCPDARDCMRQLILPAMQNVSADVDFALSYIGKYIEADDDVQCMHGPGECLGNIFQLCAQAYYPDPKSYLGFSMCMMNSYSEIPQRSLIEECALEHSIDFKRLNECASDEAMGMDLLRNSVARSANANVTTSCTVRLNEEVWCVRDGGTWKNCEGGSEPEDLIKAIEKLKDGDKE